MQVHKELKKMIEDNQLISPLDHLRSCGNHGFSDLNLTKIDNKIRPESKYLIALNLNDKPIILSHPNFYDFREEINEKMIKKAYYGGYDSKKNLVKLHYLGDGKFRVGNKKGIDEFITMFDQCNFHQLAKRYNYKTFINSLNNNEKHRALQVLICELGISQGYHVKIARNDLSYILSCDYTSDIKNSLVYLENLELSSIKQLNAKSKIDLIDIIWYDHENKKIVAAFEVERSKKYDAVLRRLSYLNDLPYNPYLICVGTDYSGFRNIAHADMYMQYFKNKKIKYLPLCSLYSLLIENDKYGKLLSIDNLFTKNLLDII